MRKLLKKKVNMFGKTVPVFVLVLLGMGLVSAALVGFYGIVLTGLVTATEPITLEEDLFTFEGDEVLNDGYNHYLLIKGENHRDKKFPVTAVITITKDNKPITDNAGLHLALDTGGDMHYCYIGGGDMYNITDCDTQYVEYIENSLNEVWFDWVGTESYVDSGFESPIVNHGDNSWYTIEDAQGTWEGGVLTLPEEACPAPGEFAALLVIRADIALEPGEYEVEVKFIPA